MSMTRNVSTQARRTAIVTGASKGIGAEIAIVVGFYHPNFGVYAATKAGVDAMTHILAKELGPRQVTVNAVAPGQVETVLFLEGKTEAELRFYADRIPLGRLGRPTDIVGIVAFLAGPESAWLSGQVIRVNGGGV